MCSDFHFVHAYGTQTATTTCIRYIPHERAQIINIYACVLYILFPDGALCGIIVLLCPIIPTVHFTMQIRRVTFLNYDKFANLLVLRLLNHERAGRGVHFRSSNHATRSNMNHEIFPSAEYISAISSQEAHPK